MLAARFEGNQSKLADELGADAGQVSRWLYGDRRPDLESALSIRDKLGIDPALFRADPAQQFTLPASAAA